MEVPEGEEKYRWQEDFRALTKKTRTAEGSDRILVLGEEKKKDGYTVRTISMEKGRKVTISVRMPPGYGKTRAILIQAQEALSVGRIPIIVVAEPYRAMVFQIVQEVWPQMKREIAEAVAEEALNKWIIDKREIGEEYEDVKVKKLLKENKEAREMYDKLREAAERRIPEPTAMVGAVDTRIVRAYLTVGTYENIALLFAEKRPRLGMLTRVSFAATMALEAVKEGKDLEWTTARPLKEPVVGGAISTYAMDGLFDTVVIDEAHNIYKERGVEIDTILRKTRGERRILLSGTMPKFITERIESVYGEMASIETEETGSPHELEWTTAKAPREERSGTRSEVRRDETGMRDEKRRDDGARDRDTAYATGIVRALRDEDGVTIAFTTSRVQAEAVAVAAYNAWKRRENERQEERRNETGERTGNETDEEKAEGESAEEEKMGDGSVQVEGRDKRKSALMEKWREEQMALTQDGNAVFEEAERISREVERMMQWSEKRGERPKMDNLREAKIYVDHAESNSQAVRTEMSREEGLKVVRFVAATTTLAEGVNVREAVRVVIPKSTLWDWAKYRQMQGRVGRFREGEVVTTVSEDEFESMTNPTESIEPKMSRLRTVRQMWEERQFSDRRVWMKVQEEGYWLPAAREEVLDAMLRIGLAGEIERKKVKRKVKEKVTVGTVEREVEREIEVDRGEEIIRSQTRKQTLGEMDQVYANSVLVAEAAERRMSVVDETTGKKTRTWRERADVRGDEEGREDGDVKDGEGDVRRERGDGREGGGRERALEVVAAMDRRKEYVREVRMEDKMVMVATSFPVHKVADKRTIEETVAAAALVMSYPRAEEGELWSWTLRYATNGRVESAPFFMEMAGARLPVSAYIGLVVGVKQFATPRENPHASKGTVDWSVAGSLYDDWRIGYIPPFLSSLLAEHFDESVLHGLTAVEAQPTHFDVAGDTLLNTERGKAVRMSRIFSHFTHWSITVVLGLSRKRYYRLSPRYAVLAVSSLLTSISQSIDEDTSLALSGYGHLMSLATDLIRAHDILQRGEEVNYGQLPTLNTVRGRVDNGSLLSLLSGWVSPFGVSVHALLRSPLLCGDFSGVGSFLASIR